MLKTGGRKLDIEKNSGIVVKIQGRFYPANKNKSVMYTLKALLVSDNNERFQNIYY